MKVKASAPGKLMLFGEHAVVYDFPCIVTAVESRIYVEVEKAQEFIVDTPQVKDLRFVEETVKVFCEKYKVNNKIMIKTYSDFSSKFGLGSSSAVTVALIYALSKLHHIEMSKREIFDLGYKIVLNIQGVGSGFDIAAATYGKTTYFVTSGKVIEPLPVNSLSLIIGYSGVKADTATIVKELKLKMVDKKTEIFGIFEKMKIVVEKAKISLVKSNWKLTGELMSQNQKLLQELGVSTEKLDKMCQASVDVGAYGAKLSGAGGGDCMIALVPEGKINDVKTAITSVGGEIIDVKSNTEGLKLEI